MTGRRPYISLRYPSAGAARNWHKAAVEVLSPTRRAMWVVYRSVMYGITGIMMVSPAKFRNIVAVINPSGLLKYFRNCIGGLSWFFVRERESHPRLPT